MNSNIISENNDIDKPKFSLPLSILSVNGGSTTSPINSPTSANSANRKFFIPSIKTSGLGLNINGVGPSSTPTTPRTPTSLAFTNFFNDQKSKLLSNDGGDGGEEKFDRRLIENEMTFIDDGIYLGNNESASNLEKLQSSKITNVLNLAGEKCSNYFPQYFKYKTLVVRDIPDEDISCLFSLILDYFIKVITIRKGIIFVHCHRGISRSSAFVILWLMWKNKWSYQKSFEYIRERRKVCSPNIGFEFQLRKFEKFCIPNSTFNISNSIRQLNLDSPKGNSNSNNSNNNLSPLLFKMIKRPDSIIIPQPVIPIISSDSLDHSTCYILRTSEYIYIWIGTNSNLTFQKPIINKVKKYINGFKKFENDNSNLIEINCNYNNNNNNSNSNNNNNNNYDFLKFKKILDSTL